MYHHLRESPPRRAEEHSEEVTWLRKRGLSGADRQRLEFGTVETHLGTVIVSHDRSADVVTIHGVVTHLADLDRDLRMGLVATSAAFSAATSDEEQAGQKAALAAVIDAVLRRHEFIAAKVRENITRQRYD
jgi:hypothetical protein